MNCANFGRRREGVIVVDGIYSSNGYVNLNPLFCFFDYFINILKCKLKISLIQLNVLTSDKLRSKKHLQKQVFFCVDNSVNS